MNCDPQDDLAPAMDDLMNALIGDIQLLGNRLQGFTGGIARTNQPIALIKGHMFIGDRSLGEGNVPIKEFKHTPDGEIEGGYGCGSKARWG
jgi:hypothetical protein